MLRKLAYSDLAMKPVSEHKAETQKLFGTAAPRLISTMSDVSGTCAVTLPPQCPLRHQLHPNRPADPRGSEAAGPKINLLKSSRTRGPGRAPLQPVPGVHPVRVGSALLGTARLWRGILPSTHLAREGRMTVTIGRRDFSATLGGAAAACSRRARSRASACGALACS